MDSNFRGWEVELGTGELIREGQMEWKEVPKVNIKTLSLVYDGRRWDLSGKNVYFQKKRASCVPGVPESFQIESRTIGYYEGSAKVMYTVNEYTGKMKMEVKEIK